jgi:hypothetical protein
MSNEWLDDAVKSSTGNVTPFEEFREELFSVFQKYRENGYPDMIIVSMVCDFTKMPMTIPQIFDDWRSKQG